MSDRHFFLGVQLKNRSVLASGILGVTFSSLKKVYEAGAGIVTTKSIGPVQRKGHPSPVVYDWGHGLINAVGLANPGIDEFVKEFEKLDSYIPLIVSIFGQQPEDFPALAQKLETLQFAFLEINISCLNVMDEFGTPFSFSSVMTAQITHSVKNQTSKPVIVKLSPNTPDIISVARAAEDAGADALCVMNTLGPGMAISTNTALPVLGNLAGGISGDAILPVTVKKVYDLYREVSIPIIGTGGITDTDSALQVLMAGATLYGIGSALYTKGLQVFRCIEEGIEEFIHTNRFSSSEEVIGLSHRQKRGSYYNVPKRSESPEESSRAIQFAVRPVEEILSNDDGSIKTLFFSNADLGKPEPGQFFMLWIPGIDQKPYSISYYDNCVIGFSLIERGAFSRALLDLQCGEPVGLLGPLGGSFELGNHHNYLLVGGGIGLAPFIFTSSELVHLGKKVSIIAGGKTSSSINWIDSLLKKLGKDERIKTYVCTEDGSSGQKGLITDFLEQVIAEVKPDFALLCGPEIFIQKTIHIFKGKGIAGQASIERMMKCGIGICGTCCLDDTGDRVCVEGPVFNFDYLEGIKEFGRYKRDESGAIQEID